MNELASLLHWIQIYLFIYFFQIFKVSNGGRKGSKTQNVDSVLPIMSCENSWYIAKALCSILGVPHLGFQFLNCLESQPFILSFLLGQSKW